MPAPAVLLAPRTTTVKIALEPAQNAMISLAMLSEAGQYSGVDQWVFDTAAALSDEDRHRTRLIFDGFFELGQLLDRSWSSFSGFVDSLSKYDPVALRDRLLAQVCSARDRSLTPRLPEASPSLMLSNRQAYLDRVRALFSDKDEFDPNIHLEAHKYFNNPPELQEVMVSHLSHLWETVMAPEWERVVRYLEESVQAFHAFNYEHLSVFEAIRAVTGRDLRPYWENEFANVEELTFVPSAHIGPYVAHYGTDTRIWLLFRARLPEGVSSSSRTFGRSELLVRLNALADDTRLRILELVIENGELCAQDIITLLDLSQSSASRHLRQLTATGYLNERRREGAKCYTLNPDRVDDTMRSLKHFFGRKQGF